MKHNLYIMVLMILLLHGCSSRNWYEGLKTSNQRQCNNVPPSEYDACMEQAGENYHDYKKNRENTKD